MSMNTIDRCNDLLAENAMLKQQRDELAAQIEVMRSALEGAVEYTALLDDFTQAAMCAALALPNTAANILRQRDARVLREVQRRAIRSGCNFATYGDVCRELERTADELEKQNG